MDSLRQMLPGVRGADRLDLLYTLLELSFHTDSVARDEFLEMLREEAESQRNYRYLIYSMIKRMQVMLGEGDLEDAILTMQEAERMSREHEDYYYMTYILSTLVELHLFAEDTEQAMAAARKMYAEVKNMGNNPRDLGDAAELIGIIYDRMGMDRDALSHFNQALEHNRQYHEAYVKENPGGFSYFHERNAYIYRLMSHIYINIPDYDMAIVYADSMMSSVGKAMELEDVPMEKFRDDIFDVEYNYAIAYLRKGDLEKGREHIDRTVQMANHDLYPDAVADRINTLQCIYYEVAGDYGKALEYCNDMIAFAKGFGDEVRYLGRMEKKAGLQKLTGDYSGAADTYAECLRLYKERGNAEYEKQLHELRTVYELDSMEMLAREERARLKAAHNLILGLIAVVTLAAAIVVIMTVNRRRLRIKNEGLFAQIENQDMLSAEIEKWKDEAMRMRALTAIPDGVHSAVPEEPKERFYRQLKELMSDPDIYTDSELTRRQLAERLGTNDTCST